MNLTCDHGSGSAAALKPYPAYKPSGVEWLGEVPAHWDVRRLKTGVNNVVNGDNVTAETMRYIWRSIYVERWTSEIGA